MSQKYQKIKLLTRLCKRISNRLFTNLNKRAIWLLRAIFGVNRNRHRSVSGGFVLPTVVMVSLIVILLTTAILFRAFDRSKNASNVRVNEIVLKAASPAIDRAKSKIVKLFADPRLPRSTPSDISLTNVMQGNVPQYTFGDETAIQLYYPISSTGASSTNNSSTAWKYPVDTDNNGKYDSFTLYGIYFRTPTTARARTPLESRAQPMDESISTAGCASNVVTSASLVGTQGWYKVGSKLKRSIFVYTISVPITDITTPSLDSSKYELFKGNKGFSALEYQQDRERLPLTNSAVIYENDLEVTPGGGLNINGRIFTNGNLLTRVDSGTNPAIRYYLVSSPYSCYYKQENSKIVVAGNIIDSRVNESTQVSQARKVQVDFFRDVGSSAYSPSPTSSPITADYINNTNKTVPGTTYGNKAAFNDNAYTQRINRLVSIANSTYTTDSLLPTSVYQAIQAEMAANSTITDAQARLDQLTLYFKQLTRRVPYNEVAANSDALGTYATTSPLQGSGDSLRPIDAWVFPYAPSDGTTETGYSTIGVNPSTTTSKLLLPATDPTDPTLVNPIQEKRLGDRVLVGNNLPQNWYKSSSFVSSETGQNINSYQWDSDTATRQRYTQAYQIADFGATSRAKFWELSAAQQPTGSLDAVGGLRVITGAGIYLPNDYDKTAKTFTNTQTKVWPDTMAMGVTSSSAGLPNDKTPYLWMRATAVYHYKDSTYDATVPATYQLPIACVSSYYDPSNSLSIRNKSGLPDVGAVGSRAAGAYTTPANVANTVTGNNSNNGVVYPAPTITVTSYRTVLDYQATLTYPSTSTVYPSGRLVNPLLKSALTKIDASTNLDLSEQSAVDSALCALQIIGDTSFTPSDTVIPHGAILETTFLDARQVKAVDKPYTTSATTYDLDVELRQPLEIHATALDLDLLRRTTHSTGEFLFPNSGVIYATRDDALPDASSETDATANNNASDLNGTDFKLDPTRRPNAIMLFNGSDISRNSTYVAAEKGLILASNLPVYIKGNLNTHAQEEFTTALDTAPGTLWSNFYTRSALNPQFACRNGQFTTCTTGETWRPATILADAITVLSNTFKLGYRSDGDYNLRDNYGNYTLGYDYNGDGSPTNASVTLDETALQFDINANGNMTDTAVVVAENAITGTVAARLNGFWDNNFVTSRSFTDANYSTGTPTSSPTGGSSSYFNNFVTPVQRRVTFSEYVMEICLKNVVTACQPDDWYVGYDLDGLNGFSQSEIKIKANELDYVLLSNSKTFDKTKLLAGTTAQAAATGYQVYPRRVAFLRWSDSSLYNSSTGPNYNKSFVMSAITTGSNAGNKYVNNGASYFYTAPTTNPNNKLLFPKNNSGKAIGSAVALGISSSGALTYINQYNIVICNLSTAAWTTGCSVFDNTTSSTYTLGSPSTAANALWFKTNNSGVANYSSSYPLWIQNTSGLDDSSAALQPLLVPVLQIQYPTITSGTTDPMTDSKDAKSQGNWFQVATATTSNVVYAQGDTPGRPATTGNTGETGGGLENAVHLLENWQGVNFTATGAFIQFKRSSYATAPWQSLITTFNTAALGYSTTGTIFGYPQGYHVTSTNVSGQILGRSPFYVTPNRLWGYDVALLTQLPDLFSQRFTSLPTNAPNEFFREVGKDDSWVQTLLCGAQSGDSGGYGSATAANYGSSYQYAVSQDQRGTCN